MEAISLIPPLFLGDTGEGDTVYTHSHPYHIRTIVAILILKSQNDLDYYHDICVRTIG